MGFSRRDILKLGLGAGQLALLSQFGLLGGGRARAAEGDGPSKVLTLYMAGGWMPAYFFCPLTNAQIATYIPPREPIYNGQEQVFFNPDEVVNLDGTGDAPAESDPTLSRIRVAKLWDEAAMGRGEVGRGNGFTPHGWAWQHYGLHENACVVHGIDQGTASHESGKISAMCGAAGAVYRAPALHSVVANALHAQYSSSRPLGAVSIGVAPVPNPFNLPSNASPTVMQSLTSLQKTLSERSDRAWGGLRGRAGTATPSYDGTVVAEPIATNPMDDYVLRRIRGLHGTTNRGTDAFFESMYEMYRTVSHQLGQDIVSVLEMTPGWENLAHPFWVPTNWSPYGTSIGNGVSSDSGGAWRDAFELSLKLLKSDLCSALSVDVRGLGSWYFDSHGNGHPDQFMQVRATVDVVGRLLGEMKATPIGDGKSLLDDTLVVIFSEFARTWPFSNKCDHWPVTSVVFAGGGVQPNRMIGNYDFTNLPSYANGPNGAPVDLIDEGGDPERRPPRSGDVVHTALKIMGVEEFFIPGGSGEIVGVRS